MVKSNQPVFLLLVAILVVLRFRILPQQYFFVGILLVTRFLFCLLFNTLGLVRFTFKTHVSHFFYNHFLPP